MASVERRRLARPRRHGGKVGDAAQALDGEFLDLGDDVAVLAGEGDVEDEEVGAGLGLHPRVAVDARGQRAVDGEALVGEGQQEVAGFVVAGNEIHGDAGGDVHQRGMERIVLRFGAEFGGKLERAEAFVLAEGDLAQALPMRAEIEMAALADVLGRVLFLDRAAGEDFLELDPRRASRRRVALAGDIDDVVRA